MENKTKSIVITALFAALVFVLTVVLPVPIPATGGYVNLGDVVILLAAWHLGILRGSVAAAIGSGLADLTLAPIYAPGTIVIKSLMVVFAYLVMKNVTKLTEKKVIAIITSGVVAEAIMVLGYLGYEAIVLGLGVAALAGVSGNIIQAVVCLVFAVAFVQVLQGVKVFEKALKAI